MLPLRGKLCAGCRVRKVELLSVLKPAVLRSKYAEVRRNMLMEGRKAVKYVFLPPFSCVFERIIGAILRIK